MAGKTLRLLLGDQLHTNHSWFARTDPSITYVMMEVRQETDYVKHHIQKIAGFFTAMRSFSEYLQNRGHRVIYLKLDDPLNRQNFTENILFLINKHQFDSFSYILPDEYRLEMQFTTMAAGLPVKVSVCDGEHFLCPRYEVRDFFGGKKQYLMERFYRHMRKKHDFLMEKGKPAGGMWNFDRQNRRAYSDSIPVQPPLLFSNNVGHVVGLLEQQNVTSFGEIEPSDFIWPVNREQALKLLAYFCDHLLKNYGSFQDAMSTENWTMFHSRLSFALNSKMLNPREVIEQALQKQASDPGRITLNQVEGFIRQILGWREYMRGIYWALMPDFASMNYFEHNTPLPSFYWDGNTSMNCLRKTIGQSLKYGYAHHIQRLMITGNFALLSGINPDEVDRWYLGVYIDAIEWVEITNTRGMSQYADGGLVATKPYVSTANYISKMSNYCSSCSYDSKKTTGAGACPFNSLFWHFYSRNRNKLRNNHRTGIMYRAWYKKEKTQQYKILGQAEQYLSKLNDL